MPTIYDGHPGDPYRPGNGTEGELFMDAWCANCVKFNGGDCPIVAATLAFDIDEDGYPEEWVFNRKGRPSCTAYSEDENERTYRCPDTPDMFHGHKTPFCPPKIAEDKDNGR